MEGTIDFRTFGTDRNARRIAVFNSQLATDNKKYRNVIPATHSVQVYTNCKYTDDFEQTITVPYFADWQKVDTVMLYPDGALPSGVSTESAFALSTLTGIYFITGRRYSSLVNGAIEFDLVYNPITSLLFTSTQITGDWIRASENITPWKQQSVISGAMKPSRIISLDGTENFTGNGSTFHLFWVSLTVTQFKTNTTDVSNDGLHIIAFPIALKNASDLYIGASADNSYVSPDSLTTENIQARTLRFPSLIEVITDPNTCLGLTSEQIKDISISRMCPFNYTVTDTTVGTGTTYHYTRFIMTDGTTSYRPLYYNNGSRSFYFYVPEYLTWQDSAIYRQGTGTITLSQMEMDCATIGIRDSNGSIVTDIPTAWFDSNRQLTFVYQCHYDFNQMYYHIGFDTDSDIGTRQTFQLPCSHLPYVGNAWDSYRAYSMAFDRESMNYSINQSDKRFAIQTATSIANTLSKGDISGLVGSAIGIAGNYASNELNKDALRFNQDLKERRIQAQPSTVYSLNYGLSYLINLFEHPQAIVINMPSNLTSTIYNNYIADYGYAVEGRATIALGQNYTQGIAFADESLGITGERLNRLNYELRNGVKAVNVI